MHDRIAERATRRNNGYNGSSRQAIVNPPAAGAAPSANSNLTLRMAQISQPRAQTSIPAASTQASSVAVTGGQLTEDEMEKLKKFNRCFNCKEEGHAARNCTRPSKPYSAVSAVLQKVELVENSASESEKV